LFAPTLKICTVSTHCFSCVGCLEFSFLVLQTEEGQGVIFKFSLVQKLLLLPLSYFITTMRSFWEKIAFQTGSFVLVFCLVHDNNGAETVRAVHIIFFLAKSGSIWKQNR
jgi:hypothetical protein